MSIWSGIIGWGDPIIPTIKYSLKCLESSLIPKWRHRRVTITKVVTVGFGACNKEAPVVSKEQQTTK